ncbi:MAG: hypothetical protein GY798_19650 [Hyphomicrobiales bacterium]|nr:hypothetical protein [Hyphomicrobiales bacterium]
MADKGEFFSESYYRHRPWLRRISPTLRVVLLGIGVLAFVVRFVGSLVIDPGVASGLSVALVVVGLILLAVGLLMSKSPGAGARQPDRGG